MSENANIKSVLNETRTFAPPATFQAQANIGSQEEYDRLWNQAKDKPAEFWGEMAENLDWFQKWDTVMDGEMPNTKWFTGGKINVSHNCLDRHLETERRNKAALIWEGEPGDTRVLRYQDLHREVCKFANVMKTLGVESGDRVTLYMPMIPELAIAMLACTRIGAVHSIIFGGFSADAIADRNNDAQAKLVVTSDGGWRRGKEIPLKATVDSAMDNSPSVEKVVVVQRTCGDVDMVPDRDLWWHDLMQDASTECEAEQLDSEHPLFILYTSGSTGKPKGVLHTSAGYLLGAMMTSQWVFDLKENDTYWCTADIGWITGHSYIVYGPLLAGATTMMFEGVPTFPDAGRFWAICEKHKVNQFYTAPTAIRALMAKGDHWPAQYDLSSLKVLGSVGEPINEEAWNWYDKHIGKGQSPIIDTWWQTETGGIMLTPLPGITDTKPTYASYPMPGVQPVLVDTEGNILEGNNIEGLLCIVHPWPSMIRTTYGDHERCRQVYFSAFENMYFTGDGARKDEDGRIRVIGRVDDVINVSGHRMGTAEVENAINEHPNVVESAVVGYPHDIKGQGIYAYVISQNKDLDDQFRKEILAVVTKEIGPIAKPDKIQFVEGLPKTRSGKIMRRILRKIASSDTANLGDTSTLLNPDVVEDLKTGALV